jgi:chemotaxis protein MotB
MRILLLFIALQTMACVSTKKYDELLLRKNQLELERDRLSKFEPMYADCDSTRRVLDAALADARERLAFFQENMKGLESSTQELAARYEQAVRDNKRILRDCGAEKDSLQQALAQSRTALDRCAREIRDWEMRFEKQLMWSEKYKSDLTERDSLIESLQSRLEHQRSEMERLKGNIERALARFKSDELSIRQEGGRIYISMSQKLLFAKGSDRIDARGVEAIRDLASVLKEQSDLRITVEGHTDSDGDAALNWDLSTRRATTVVKTLSQHGVDPRRLTAAGKGLYHPIAPNDTEPNKSLNRRTEIIVEPDLESLFKVLEN